MFQSCVLGHKNVMKENEPTLALSLTVKDGSKALDFYAKAFGAKELLRMPMPDGSIAHAEFMVGNTTIYLSEDSPEWHAVALPDGATAPCLFAIGVENCDEAFAQAVAAGAEPLMEPADQFWGMRVGMVKDLEGYRWSFRQCLEEISPEEMMERAQAAMQA